jgi:plasmid stabilization system protein ParE
VLRYTSLSVAEADIASLAASYATETRNRAARPEAVLKLKEAITGAVDALIMGRVIGRRYPSTYEDIAREGEEWLRIHRYWFGYVLDGDRAIVFAVLDAMSDMLARR